MYIVQKKVTDLSKDEKMQLIQLLQEYYPTAKQSFITARTSLDKGYDFVLLKSGNTILGANLFRLTKEKNSWWNRNRYTLQFGLSVKQKSYRGNIIWRLGTWYAKKNIGLSFLFQNMVGLTTTISPKVFENFIKFFPSYHCENKDNQSFQALQYAKNHFEIGYQDHFRWCDNSFCFDSCHELGTEDITDHWEKTFKAKQEWINDFFIDKGIIQKVKNRIYKMPRHIVVCGVRQPLSFSQKQVKLLRS